MMNGDFLVDTNVVVDFFRGYESVVNRLSQEVIYLPAIVIGELFYGAYASKLIRNRKERVSQLLYFIENQTILQASKCNNIRILWED